MKFIRFFIVTAMVLFTLDFSTVSAAPVLAAAPATFSKAGTASNAAPQHRRRIRRHRRRIHRHHH